MLTVLGLGITLVAAVLYFSSVSRTTRTLLDQKNNPDQILELANELAWGNQWSDAAPLFAKAEILFNARGDAIHALYAKVSQIPPLLETSNVARLIPQLKHFLALPTAADPELRLRILTVLAKADFYYDATTAKDTWRLVELLANQQHKYRLAWRATGEQGILAFSLGNFAEAQKQVTKAYLFAKYLGDPTAQMRYASAYGSGLVELQRYAEAMPWLDEAIYIAARNPTISEPFNAYVYKIDALSGLGKNNEAHQLANIALGKLTGPSIEQYSLRISKGTVFQRQGNPAGAVAEFRQAASIVDHLSFWRGVAVSEGMLAKAYEETGDLTSALTAINKALQANEQIPDELYYLPSNLAIKAEIETKLGHTNSAQLLYNKGVDLIDSLLASAPNLPIERQLLSDLGDLYSDYFALECEHNDYATAFLVIETARGRIEAQTLAHHEIAPPHSVTPIEKHINNLRLQLLNTDDQNERTRLLVEIDQLEVQNDSSTPLGSLSKTKPISLHDLQNTLASGELLIEYVLRSRISYALAVTRTSINVYRLPNKQALESHANHFINLLSNQKADLITARQIFDDLLGSIPEYFKSPSIIIVPDGKLHLMPFPALIDHSGQAIIATHTVSIVPSGTVLEILRSHPQTISATSGYLGVAAWTQNANPTPFLSRWFRFVFGSDVGQGKKYGLPNHTDKSVLETDNSPRRSNLAPLPASRNEVESIASILILSKPSIVLLGSAATKTDFLKLHLDTFNVLHLALHGYADMQFPDRSALLFAPTINAFSSDAGILNVSDILRLRLNASLITLSACNTGVGRVGQPGVDAIAEAFIQAGARTVVSSLWELDDHATAHLMQAFYRRLAQGEQKVQALRLAQMELASSGVPPYYWAGLEMVGDPSGTVVTR